MAIMVTTALVFTAACSNDDGGGGAGRPDRVTACDTLSAGDLEIVLDAPVGPPDAAEDQGTDVLAGRSGCAWATDDDTKAVLVELVGTRDMSGSVRRTGFSARARFAAARDRHPDATKVQGPGDDAIWVEEAATLHVLVDDYYLTVEVAVPEPAAAERTAVDLAVRAVRHLADLVATSSRAD